jgi:hypothetical protein
MSVGRDLLDVPFPQMIFSMAQAIAKSQLALDKSSINTLQMLASTEFDWIPEITEVLYAKPIDIQSPNAPGGLTVTGVGVDLEAPKPTKLTLLQAGINPTFYQFTDSTIEVKMSITSTTSSENSLEAGVSTTASFNDFFASGSISAHVNFSSSNKYSYSVTGSSSLSTTLKPVPAPQRIYPTFILVDATNPAQVKITKS